MIQVLLLICSFNFTILSIIILKTKYDSIKKTPFEMKRATFKINSNLLIHDDIYKIFYVLYVFLSFLQPLDLLRILHSRTPLFFPFYSFVRFISSVIHVLFFSCIFSLHLYYNYKNKIKYDSIKNTKFETKRVTIKINSNLLRNDDNYKILYILCLFFVLQSLDWFIMILHSYARVHFMLTYL